MKLVHSWNALGVIESRDGQPQVAIEAWRKAVEADPRMADALFNLGLMLGREGDRNGALEALQRYAELAHGEDRVRAEEMIRELRPVPPS